MMTKPARIVLLALFYLNTGCRSEAVPLAIEPPEPSRTIAEIPADVWQRLASRRIFFGHQSVGANIVDGLKILLAENPQIDLRIIHAADPNSVTGPAFIESPLGRNGDPSSKNHAFAEALEAGLGENGDIAMYKYCYVDFSAATDVERVFEEYQGEISVNRQRYPGVLIVHMTVPLNTDDGRRKYLLDRLLRRTTTREVNVKRNRFNELLLAAYTGVEPVFDLAGIESTRPDGSRAYVRSRGRNVYMLAPELTDDGGHLNELGQRLVAERFLVFLAELEQARRWTPELLAERGN